jgi:adenine-specific DNA-methyltransferase
MRLGDILYIDPPYNNRQYAPNFHILETLACWDNPKISGKTGLRPYNKQKSFYSLKLTCKEVFADLIEHANAKHILFSYNSEGIIPKNFILKTLETRGKVKVYKQKYRRFRTERDHEKRHYKVLNNIVTENIFYVKT